MLHFLFKSTCDVFCTFESHSILRLGFLRTETFWSLYLCVPKADRLNSRRTWEKGQPTIAVPILRTGRPTTFCWDSSEVTWEVRGRATTSVPFGHEVPLGAIQKDSPLLAARCPHYMLSCGSLRLSVPLSVGLFILGQKLLGWFIFGFPTDPSRRQPQP